jgi:phospholipid/cholesterol/gamma-HCH transport system substrate-binding protein
MSRLTVEAKVGFFVVIGIMILAYMSMKVGKFKYGPERGYSVHGYFGSAEGLVEGVPVKIAGVEVGRVEEITLEAGKAKVRFLLNPDVEIGQDVQASIRTKGILGDKYVELIPGSPQAPSLKPGGRIALTESPTNIDTLLKQLSSVGKDVQEITRSFSAVLGGPEGQASLKIMVDNLRDMSRTLNETVQKNDENINRMLDNLTVFAKDLRNLSGTNKEALNETVANFREASGQLRETILALSQITDKINRGEGAIGKLVHDEETVESLNETLLALKEISAKINRGEGTIGKLVQDEETADNLNATLTSINEFVKKEERFRTYVDYRGEYLFDSDFLKSYLSLRIQPQEDKYYLLQVVDDPGGERKETIRQITVDGVTTTTEEVIVEKDALKWSAQIAKRYYDLGLRAGIFESKGGLALDYYLLDDHLMFSMEAFDFRVDERPHLKFRADFTPFRFLYVTGGYDDFISDYGLESFFLGAGIHFSDEDIKTLLYGAPIPR